MPHQGTQTAVEYQVRDARSTAGEQITALVGGLRAPRFSGTAGPGPIKASRVGEPDPSSAGRGHRGERRYGPGDGEAGAHLWRDRAPMGAGGR